MIIKHYRKSWHAYFLSSHLSQISWLGYLLSLELPKIIDPLTQPTISVSTIQSREYSLTLLGDAYHCTDDLLLSWIYLLCLCLIINKFTLFGRILTSQTGGLLPYSDTHSNEVIEHYLYSLSTVTQKYNFDCKEMAFFI